MADGSDALRAGNSSAQAIETELSCYPTVALGIPSFLVPKSVSDVKELARMIALAEWAPDCYRDIDGNFHQQKIELAIMHGASVGLGPIAAVQAIALLNGTPSIWGDGALSVIEHSGLLEDMVEDYEVDDEQGLVAVCTMKRRGRATPIVTRFSLAMAEHAGLTRNEGPWQTYPERMLRMRARSWTMRDGFADVLRGLHLREEVDDYVFTRRERPRRSPQGEADPLGSSRQYPPPRPQRSAEAAAAPLSGDSSTGHLPPPPDHAASDRHDQPSAPDQALVLEINSTWGDQKVFQTYRAALTKLSSDAAPNRPRVREFRRANRAIENRLRGKFGERMKQIDEIYELAAAEAGSDAAA